METRKFIARMRYLVGAIIGVMLAVPLGAAALPAFNGTTLFNIGGSPATQIVPVYPTWSINIPLPPPMNFAAASSTSPGGSLSTSTAPMYFRVAATNGTGTTTASTELSTTTMTGSSQINFTWTPVPNATKYFVYFSTTTPGTENAYYIATSSSAYDFTSTSTPNYGTIPSFPSSFALQLSNATNTVISNGLNVSPLSTTTASLGGGALTAGQCATATSTLSVGTLSSTTVFMTTPQKYPGSGVVWQSYALSSTQVVTELCGLLNTTPAATVYNIRALL